MTYQGPTALPTATDTASLLEQANTQWQTGDWHSLAKLQHDTLQHHPDRAHLALLAAAGRLQMGKDAEAKPFIRLAQEWGASKQHIGQMLIAGVHNSLGRAAAIGNQEQRALQHFENAIIIGMLGSNKRLLTETRMIDHYSRIQLDNTSPMVALEKYHSASLLHQETDLEGKVRKLEKNFTFLLQKEKNRLQTIIEYTHLISGLKRPLKNKIFCIGSNKTGTTSLDSAMRILGFTTIPEDLAYQYLTLGNDEQAQERKFRSLLETQASKFNFFEDLPFCYRENYKVIDEVFPGAKFILTIRPADEWFLSCIRWIGRLDCEFIYNWIWGVQFIPKNKKIIIDLYNKRNEDIKNYFSSDPGKLLVLRIDKASFANLCDFLDIDVSLKFDLDFPKENINDLKY